MAINLAPQLLAGSSELLPTPPQSEDRDSNLRRSFLLLRPSRNLAPTPLAKRGDRSPDETSGPFQPDLTGSFLFATRDHSRWVLPTTFSLDYSRDLCSDFPHPDVKSGRNYPIPAYTLYKICFFFASMIHFICECEVILTFIVNNICAAKNTFGCFLFL